MAYIAADRPKATSRVRTEARGEGLASARRSGDNRGCPQRRSREVNITGTSVNPARSIGPAIAGMGTHPQYVAQLWLFIIAPLIGAGLAGFLYREGALLYAKSK